MTTLISLPAEVLQDLFQNINQHQALALAPLHSYLNSLTKAKLYHRILVYKSSQLGASFEGPTGRMVDEFRYHKTINNLKSNSYTIISINTLEKYMTRMEKDQVITRFEIMECNFMILDCILRYFTSIKTLEVISQDSAYSRHSFHECLRIYSNSVRPKTCYLPHKDPYRYGFLNEDYVTKLKILDFQLQEAFEFVEQLHGVKELVLDFYHRRSEIAYFDFRSSLMLQKLHLAELPQKSVSYFSDAFCVKKLSELTISGELFPTQIFKNRDFSAETPNLIQLSILFKDEYALLALQDMQKLRHYSLKALVVSTYECGQNFANAVCELRASFPLASINWWHNSEKFLLDHSCDVLAAFSPSLATNIVGCHIRQRFSSTLSRDVIIHLDCGKKMIMKLKHYYSDFELSQIHKGTESREYHILSDNINGKYC
ncbi:hypothetical protein KGF57_000286 [Candida theae]|uniref:F-box domain-containing protein n=1 Tax=Candida theae TaxID=1198502 RepID=A0AAD5G111_9ASCO|nr:uncharacterized protein KGF57_000286 [Candida theae]KAI5967802.1 hypothetical protein KGF57_000286 [Candida theae]